MYLSLSLIRLLFICLSICVTTTYVLQTFPGGTSFTNCMLGLSTGFLFGLTLIGLDVTFRNWNLRSFNVALVGIGIGYLLGQSILLIINTTLNLSALNLTGDLPHLLKAAIFLSCTYFGVVLTFKNAEKFLLSIPFVRLTSSAVKKKDILIDWTILTDARVLELASSGLFDDHLIVPRFIIKEIYLMLENSDEQIRNKARRCLEVFKKLETITPLELRYSDVDFPDVKDSASKLMLLAHQLNANILTSDVTRLQPYVIEGIRIINIHMLATALKPITGEQLNIKIQRYGKEPRQGVGYMEDGTMVVVNGGAEYIGETIRAHVLSVKHTSSGRMIFCNANDEPLDAALSHAGPDLDMTAKNFYSI